MRKWMMRRTFSVVNSTLYRIKWGRCLRKSIKINNFSRKCSFWDSKKLKWWYLRLINSSHKKSNWEKRVKIIWSSSLMTNKMGSDSWLPKRAKFVMKILKSLKELYNQTFQHYKIRLKSVNPNVRQTTKRYSNRPLPKVRQLSLKLRKNAHLGRRRKQA